MIEDLKKLDDSYLISLVQALDVLSLPIERRFLDDDKLIVEFMKSYGMNQTIVDKLLIGSLILREVVSRGLTIPTKN